MENEICGLYSLTFYPKCIKCLGKDKTQMCYTTKEEVKKHIEDFYKRFEIDENLLERRFD